ncbi:MAG: hypothetical protein ACREQV_10035, partial [Candidatus Binatia bacterium]
LAYRESAELAKKLIEQTIERENIEAADRFDVSGELLTNIDRLSSHKYCPDLNPTPVFCSA